MKYARVFWVALAAVSLVMAVILLGRFVFDAPSDERRPLAGTLELYPVRQPEPETPAEGTP